MKTRNAKVDIMKLVSACMVLFLHTVNLSRDNSGFIGMVDEIIYKGIWVINPVEFFFVMSSYFLFIKPLSKREIKIFLKRLTILYTFWSIFYMGNIFSIFQENSIPVAILKCVRVVFFLGTGGHMWYVLSLVYSVLLLYPLLARGKKFLAWIIGGGFYVLNLLGDSYYYLLRDDAIIKKIVDFLNLAMGNMYLFRGAIFVMIGYTLATRKRPFKTEFVFGCFILSGLFNCMEHDIIRQFGIGLQYSVTIFKPLTSLLLCYCLTSKDSMVNKDLSFCARFSTTLYFLHIFVRNLLDEYILNAHLMFLVVFVMCFITTIFMDYIARHRRFNWIKKVY